MSKSDDTSRDASKGQHQEGSGTYTRRRAVRRSFSDAEMWQGSAPELEITETEAGRETLGAIAAELRPDTPRAPIATRPYADRISNAPGARLPSPSPAALTAVPGLARRDASAPEITIGRTPAGRDTMAAIAAELHADSSADSASEEPNTLVRQRSTHADSGAHGPPARSERRGAISVPSEETSVYEMATFVVRCDPIHLASNYARRRFVEERLLHRLPVASMDLVDRIDVTPWTVRDTLIVRVWCIVPPP